MNKKLVIKHKLHVVSCEGYLKYAILWKISSLFKTLSRKIDYHINITNNLNFSIIAAVFVKHREKCFEVMLWQIKKRQMDVDLKKRF